MNTNMIGLDLEVYLEDGLINIENIANGDTDHFSILHLADELIAEYSVTEGPQPPLTRIQVQELYAVSGQLAMAALRINEFVKRNTPR